MFNEDNTQSFQLDDLSLSLFRREIVQALRVIELKIAIKNRSGKYGGDERERSSPGYDEDNGEETTRTISVETERPG